MTYLDSPVVALVATDCACCGKPLMDAVSVETAVGPECRRKHGGWTKKNGFGLGDGADWARATMLLTAAGIASLVVDGDTRATCNRVVYRLACGLGDNRAYACAVAALAALGYRRLADACAPDLFTVRIEADGDDLVVKSKYNEVFNHSLRNVPATFKD